MLFLSFSLREDPIRGSLDSTVRTKARPAEAVGSLLCNQGSLVRGSVGLCLSNVARNFHLQNTYPRF